MLNFKFLLELSLHLIGPQVSLKNNRDLCLFLVTLSFLAFKLRFVKNILLRLLLAVTLVHLLLSVVKQKHDVVFVCL